MTAQQITWLETLMLNAIKAQQEKGYAKAIRWWHVEMECDAFIFQIPDVEQRGRVQAAFHQNKLALMRGMQAKKLIRWETEGGRASFSIA